MALTAVVHTGLVPLVASRAWQIPVVLAVRILFVGIFWLRTFHNGVIETMALHAGLMPIGIFLHFRRSRRIMADLALDASFCMTIRQKLLGSKSRLSTDRTQDETQHSVDNLHSVFFI